MQLIYNRVSIRSFFERLAHVRLSCTDFASCQKANSEDMPSGDTLKITGCATKWNLYHCICKFEIFENFKLYNCTAHQIATTICKIFEVLNICVSLALKTAHRIPTTICEVFEALNTWTLSVFTRLKTNSNKHIFLPSLSAPRFTQTILLCSDYVHFWHSQVRSLASLPLGEYFRTWLSH